MKCPRCESELDRYTLGGREAVGCGSCGYVGVPVEHRGERRSLESWDEAIDRYADAAASGSVTIETIGGEPALELVLNDEPAAGASPEPTVVRVARPDPALAAAFEAADGSDERFVCDICGAEFDTQRGLYGHLAIHSGEKDGDS
jgi:transposase-like protein